MGGLTRRRARGILVLGGLAILLPFLHLGGSAERPESVQPEVRAEAALPLQAAEPGPSHAGTLVPVTPVSLHDDAPVPEAAALHLLVAD
ncbi:MAG TPA: hypothetical protein VNS22_09850 [Geminicoccus sp.]|uniref:hypothetical protein n=1 Tax=Geminicoccus sp. TaxID=2024832 RepID=UPI002C38C1DA|nr:hypothetical protein [Geminicoccus sp.]HWL68672.1 hypothetical protein [Geminicoccus sp.]